MSGPLRADHRLQHRGHRLLIYNPTHDHYVSLWAKGTKAETNAYMMLELTTSATNANSLVKLAEANAGPTSIQPEHSYSVNGTASIGTTQRQAVATNNWRGTLPATISIFENYLSTWGNSTIGNRNVQGTGGSFVFQRPYLEGLTVSDRIA